MTYRYRRYRSRRLRRRERRAALAVAGVLTLAAVAGHSAAAGKTASAPGAGAAAPSTAAAHVIAFARSRLGCPYVWGGTGPCQDGYDCSGLAMQAYAAAGISIQRTSQEQWAEGPQAPAPAPGDLVFFAGADGTPSAPGHVGIVVDPARHLMIDAYETGAPVRYDTYGLPGSAGGLSDPVGFTDPAAGRS